MRPSEYMALTGSDFDLERGTASVSKTLAAIGVGRLDNGRTPQKNRITAKRRFWVGLGDATYLVGASLVDAGARVANLKWRVLDASTAAAIGL
jgi:hypothetical protein